MARAKRVQKKQTRGIDVLTIMERFGDEQKCWEYLVRLRFPAGVACIRCGSVNVGIISTRRKFHCRDCRRQFSVTTDTVLADTHLPLRKWIMAVFLMCESKKGISANQLARMLHTTYETSWFLCHRIRWAMGSVEPETLDGTVEVDETYVGGKTRGMGRGYVGNKTMVLGAKERGGSVHLRVEQHANRRTLHGFIREVTADETEAIYTDDWPAYRGIGDEDTRHESVNHSAKEYVRGDVHTNGIESVWSLLDRSMIGAFHQVTTKHLPSYLDELEFRFNNRENPYLFRDTILRLLNTTPLRFKALVGDDTEERATADAS